MQNICPVIPGLSTQSLSWVMEQKQMSKLLTGAAVPVCRRFVSCFSTMTDLFTWGLETWPGLCSLGPALSRCLGQAELNDCLFTNCKHADRPEYMDGWGVMVNSYSPSSLSSLCPLPVSFSHRLSDFRCIQRDAVSGQRLPQI